MRGIFNKGYGSGGISAIAWGIDTVLVGVILTLTPFIETKQVIMLAPFISVFLHDLFSTLWIFIYIVVKGQLKSFFKTLKTPSIKYVVFASILGGPIGMTGYLLAIKYIGPSYTAAISSIYPAVGAVIASIFLKEKISKRVYIGLCLSILGITLLGFTSYDSNITLIGFVFVGLSVLGWGGESVVCSYGMKDEYINPKKALQIRQFISATFSGIIIIPFLKGFSLVGEVFLSNTIWLIILTALMGTISYVCYYTAIHELGSTRAMGINITYVVWAMIFERVSLGNPITFKRIICSLMVIIGSFVVAAQPVHEEKIKEIANNI